MKASGVPRLPELIYTACYQVYDNDPVFSGLANTHRYPHNKTLMFLPCMYSLGLLALSVGLCSWPRWTTYVYSNPRVPTVTAVK